MALRLDAGALPGHIGRTTLELTAHAGRAAVFLGRMILAVVRPPFRGPEIVRHLRFIGHRSLSLIVLTSVFAGMVLTLQGYKALVDFGSESRIGAFVGLVLVRELGPVLGALMVTARAGSAIAATLGTMRISQQLDALEAMSVDPVQYAVMPRFVASLVAVPLLAAIFTVAGIGSGYVFASEVLGVDGSTYMSSARSAIEWTDVRTGLWKSVIFGVLIPWRATFRGYYASGGAEGIGHATTRAVVEISALILVGNYVVAALLF